MTRLGARTGFSLRSGRQLGRFLEFEPRRPVGELVVTIILALLNLVILAGHNMWWTFSRVGSDLDARGALARDALEGINETDRASNSGHRDPQPRRSGADPLLDPSLLGLQGPTQINHLSEWCSAGLS